MSAEKAHSAYIAPLILPAWNRHLPIISSEEAKSQVPLPSCPLSMKPYEFPATFWGPFA